MELCRNKVGHSKPQLRSKSRRMQFPFIHSIPFFLFRSTSSKSTTNSHSAPHRPTISTISARKSINCRNMTTPSDYKVKTSPVPSHQICKWVNRKLFPSFSDLIKKTIEFLRFWHHETSPNWRPMKETKSENPIKFPIRWSHGHERTNQQANVVTDDSTKSEIPQCCNTATNVIKFLISSKF